jgi:hypothetical protein
MKNNNLNEMLIDLGIEQFIRNEAIKVLQKYSGKKDTTIEELMKEINIQIMDEFKKKAQTSFEKLLVDIKKLVA